MTEAVLMEEMSWTQVREAIASGRDVAVFACGASEQHGPHLPTCTDALLGTAIAVRAARRAGNALVAPTIRPGLSQHHAAFAGTISLRPETFLGLLEDYCRSLEGHGFRRIVMFPSHGGNVDMMRAHLPYLARQLDGRCEVALWTRGLAEDARRSRWLEEQGIGRGRAGVHAGFSETSMVLAERADLVGMERATPGLTDEEFYRPERLAQSQIESFLRGIHHQSPNGVLGDPTGANAEAGVALLEMAAESLAEELLAGAPSPSRG
jgi:creatinine amidohydrolase